jgi:uncharacterized protein YwgA
MLDRKLYKIIEQTLGEQFIKDYPNDFHKRKIVQKMLYLVTNGKNSPKIELPYDWNFYLHGPYCPDIAHMIYHINDLWYELKNYPISLNDSEKESIEHFLMFKKRIDYIKTKFSEFTEDELYEILATLTYAAKQVGDDNQVLIESFIRFKPDLKYRMNEQISDFILSNLKEFEYI